MAALQEVLAVFGVKFDAKDLDKGQGVIDKTIGSLRMFGQVIAGSLFFRQAARFVNRIIEFGDELDKTAQQIGLTTQELQSFRYAATLGGVGAQEFSNSLGQLQRRASDAANHGGRAAETFRRVGIEVKGADGEVKDAATLFHDLANAIKNTDNPTERTAIAMELMGRTGRRLLPILTEGSEGLAGLQAEARALGGGISSTAIQASVKLTDNLARLNFVMMGVKARIAVVLLPMIDKTVVAFQKVGIWILKVTKKSNIFKVAMVALGAVAAAAVVKVLIAWGAALAPLLLAGLAVGILVLWFDDLWTLLKGGDSLLGDLIDGFYGVGAAAEAIEGAKLFFSDLFDIIKRCVSAVLDLNDAISSALGIESVREIVGELTGSRDQTELDEFTERSNQARQARQARQAEAEREGSMVAGATSRAWRGGAKISLADDARLNQALDRGLTDAEFVEQSNRARRERQATATTVDATTNVNVNIVAQGADANEVARLAQQRVEQAMEVRSRQTLNALESLEAGS